MAIIARLQTGKYVSAEGKRTCPICGQMLKNSRGVKTHMRMIHEGKYFPESVEVVDDPAEDREIKFGEDSAPYEASVEDMGEPVKNSALIYYVALAILVTLILIAAL